MACPDERVRYAMHQIDEGLDNLISGIRGDPTSSWAVPETYVLQLSLRVSELSLLLNAIKEIGRNG